LSPNFPGMVLPQKFEESVMGRGQKIGIFRFSRDRPAMRHGRQIGHCNGHYQQAIGAHTGAGGQCPDAIETGVGADGPARIVHTGTGSGRGLRRAKRGTGLLT